MPEYSGIWKSRPLKPTKKGPKDWRNWRGYAGKLLKAKVPLPLNLKATRRLSSAIGNRALSPALRPIRTRWATVTVAESHELQISDRPRSPQRTDGLAGA